MSDRVEVSPATVDALVTVISGGSHTNAGGVGPYGPYRSGPEILQFFRPFGFDESYASGFGSRQPETRERLVKLNGTPAMKHAIEAAVDPRHFIELDEVSDGDAADYLNEYLLLDGYKLVRSKGRFRLRSTSAPPIEAGKLSFKAPPERHEMIQEQIAKCERRLEEGDYTGAITSARSLVEGVLQQVEALLDPSPPKYNGKLSPLYTRVYRRLNLDPGREDLDNTIKQVLTGLISVISGLAPMRNQMGDAHPFEYRPHRHHAELAVNAAKTVVNFLDGTLTYQQEKGLLDLPEASPS
jgi:hypothetical protein